MNSSAIIDRLASDSRSGETLVYFYCDFRNPRTTSAMEVIRSLTVQLLRNANTDWFSSFSDVVTRKNRGAGPPVDLDVLLDLLKRAAKLHDHPIIVIDALDECDDLPDLLDALVKLNGGHIRIFATSRTAVIIKEAFSGFPSISLNDMVEAVRGDMSVHVKTELESRRKLRILGPDLKDEILGLLLKKADGMYV